MEILYVFYRSIMYEFYRKCRQAAFVLHFYILPLRSVWIVCEAVNVPSNCTIKHDSKLWLKWPQTLEEIKYNFAVNSTLFPVMKSLSRFFLQFSLLKILNWVMRLVVHSIYHQDSNLAMMAVMAEKRKTMKFFRGQEIYLAILFFFH